MNTSLVRQFSVQRRLALLLIINATIAILIYTGVVHADCERSPLRGVNLSGAEFGNQRPGVIFKDYTYPSRITMRYFSDLGMGVIRLPFLWERIQHAPYAPLDAAELAQLKQIVRWGVELNLCVLLDLHNYGRYRGNRVGTRDLDNAALVDLWLRLQREFPDPKAVALGLMNEPAALSNAEWFVNAQAIVLALRSAGARNLLMVASPRWSGAHEFEKKFSGASAAQAFSTFKDPLNHYAIELHQYADRNFSGTSSHCIDPERLRTFMSHVEVWARANKMRLFLGEFGVANTPACLKALKALLESMQNKDVWLGWTYWSAGAWWGSYPFSIQPSQQILNAERNDIESLTPPTTQLTILQPFLTGPMR